jgi:hypothetical protein
MKILSFFILVFVFASCKSTKHGDFINLCFWDTFNKKVETISLADIKQIEKLNGKFVLIEGYLHQNFEDAALYPSESSDSQEAIWLNLTDRLSGYQKELQTINYRKVAVIGKINLSNKGHYNGYIAALDSVSCINQVK